MFTSWTLCESSVWMYFSTLSKSTDHGNSTEINWFWQKKKLILWMLVWLIHCGWIHSFHPPAPRPDPTTWMREVWIEAKTKTAVVLWRFDELCPRLSDQTKVLNNLIKTCRKTLTCSHTGFTQWQMLQLPFQICEHSTPTTTSYIYMEPNTPIIISWLHRGSLNLFMNWSK